MSGGLLLTTLFVLAGWSANAQNDEYAFDPYDQSRHWVEKQCATNTVPEDERIFVLRWFDPRYAAIVRFHKGITLREIIDQSPVKGKVLEVDVWRTEPFKNGHNTLEYTFRIRPSDMPKFKLRSQDVILLRDPGSLPHL